MKPVHQEFLLDPATSVAGRRPDGRVGDCLRACVATILEIDLDAVPHFCQTGREFPENKTVWAYAYHGFLSHHGVVLRTYTIGDADELPRLFLPDYCILSGPGARGVRHCVVGYAGQMVWDPHPSGLGLETIDELEVLVPITDAARELLARVPELHP